MHGINYLGDIGLHMGKLIYAINTWGNPEELQRRPLQEFLRLYVKFCNEESSAGTEEGEVAKPSLDEESEESEEIEDASPLTKQAKGNTA